MSQPHPASAPNLNINGTHRDDSSPIWLEKDIAAAIVPEHAQEIDPVAEGRVLRKIDMFLIPLMWIGYGLVYYDKVTSCSSLQPSTDCLRPYLVALFSLE